MTTEGGWTRGPSGGVPHSRGVSFSLRGEAHPERTHWDPKDGELCLARTNEVRGNPDGGP
ncbi:hypothetical protein J6590_088680 [Homalodisca vitripennis]|nr:hypothetical protein J6590_088680 [Homalodisca vitripennis]